MPCSIYVCSPDSCVVATPTDQLNATPVEETIDYSNGSFASNIKVGSVTWKVELKLGTIVKVTMQSVQPSASISVTQPIPGAVISKATEYVNEHARDWLYSASQEDGYIAFLADYGQIELEHLAEAGLGQDPWRGTWKPYGSMHGNPFNTLYVTIDYYTTGTLKGCEVGSSPEFAADGYPCGVGSFEINGDLWWEAPLVPPYTNFVLDNFMNRAEVEAAFLDSLTTPISPVVTSIENQVASMIPSIEYSNFASASASVPSQEGGNSLILGGGAFFGGVVVNAFNPDGSQVGFQFNGVKFCDPAFNMIDDPALQGLARVGYASSFTLSLGQMTVDAATGKTQQAVNTFRQILNPPRQQAAQVRVVYQTTVQTVIQGSVDGANQATASVAGQPVQSGSLTTSGVTINNSGATQNSVSGGRGSCWLARAVYGETSIEWLKFRKYLKTEAPEWMHNFYMEYAPKIAKKLRKDNLRSKLLKNVLKPWMSKKIRNISL